MGQLWSLGGHARDQISRKEKGKGPKERREMGKENKKEIWKGKVGKKDKAEV